VGRGVSPRPRGERSSEQPGSGALGAARIQCCGLGGCILLAPGPDFLVEKIGHGINGGLDHGNQAADQDIAGQQVGHRERDCKVSDGKGNCLQQRLVTVSSVLVNEHFHRAHDQLRLRHVYGSI